MKKVENSEAFTRFRSAMRQILAVSKDELLRREAAYKRQADANPNKRGPKPKTPRKSNA